VPRSHGEPEYLRRIREKAEKNQSEANKEKWKTQYENRISQLASAIHRIEENSARERNQDGSYRRRELRINRYGVIGVWVAAAVAIIAVWASYISSRDQWGVMRDQLTEMQSSSEEVKQSIAATNRLADQARRAADIAEKTAERQLRAYVGVLDVTIECELCDSPDANNIPKTIPPDQWLKNSVTMTIQNGGVTPAYNLFAIDTWYAVPFGKKLPKNFDFTIKDTGNDPGRPSEGVGTLNPGEKAPSYGTITTSALPLIIRAKKTRSYSFSLRLYLLYRHLRRMQGNSVLFQICARFRCISLRGVPRE
jgi:hypothetical protein